MLAVWALHPEGTAIEKIALLKSSVKQSTPLVFYIAHFILCSFIQTNIIKLDFVKGNPCPFLCISFSCSLQDTPQKQIVPTIMYVGIFNA